MYSAAHQRSVGRTQKAITIRAVGLTGGSEGWTDIWLARFGPCICRIGHGCTSSSDTNKPRVLLLLRKYNFAPKRSQCFAYKKSNILQSRPMHEILCTCTAGSFCDVRVSARIHVRMHPRTSRYGHDAVQSRASPSLSRIREFCMETSCERVTRNEVPSSVRQSSKPDSRAST